MLDIPKFIYHQQPTFWFALSATLFVLGLLYANVSLRTWKRRLSHTERQQASLLEERQKAIADREHRRQMQSAQLAQQEARASDPLAKSVPIKPRFETKELPQNERAPITVQANGVDAARAKAIAGLFSSSYDSGPNRQSGDNGESNGHANEHTKASSVRPNPWTNYS